VLPLIERGADTLVLGCTHYPLVRGLIADIAGPGVAVTDAGAAVARHLRSRLADCKRLLRTGGDRSEARFWTSADPPGAASALIERIWGEAAR
jgi:glutamate racemase